MLKGKLAGIRKNAPALIFASAGSFVGVLMAAVVLNRYDSERFSPDEEVVYLSKHALKQIGEGKMGSFTAQNANYTVTITPREK